MQPFDLSIIKSKKILGVGAHPDDLEFCAGGTLFKLSTHNSLTTLVVTDGRMGTHDPHMSTQEIAKTRNIENHQAATLMGVGNDIYWSYPDFGLKSYESNLRRRLLKFLLKLRPDIVITFDPWGAYEPLLHPDHRTLAWSVVETVLASTLPLHLKKVGIRGEILSPKPQLWLMVPLHPNIAVDITPVWNQKWQIIETHQSQFDEHVDFAQLRSRLSRTWFEPWGKSIDTKYAEAFRIMEYLPEE